MRQTPTAHLRRDPDARNRNDESRADESRADESTDPVELLIAEDDDALRSTLLEMFQRRRCKVIGAATGTEFLERLRPKILGDDGHWSPDVIITDVNMPGIPPLEVVDGLRRVGREVPCVVISGLRDPDVRKLVLSMGMPWLDKPLDPFILEDTVRRALAEHFRRITLNGER